jgi:hypothetical protein
MPVSSDVWGVNLNGLGFVLRWLDDIKQEPAEVVWVVGTDVEYAVYLEFGTRNHPPYPFLFPAARDVMNTQGNRIFDEAESLDEAIENIAKAVEKQAKINATAGRGDRSPGTHPDHPKIVSGELRNSIEAERVA